MTRTLILGGSKGIGRAIRQELKDHSVIYICRNEDPTLSDRWMELDLMWDGTAIQRVVKSAIEELGGIDNLIISSGEGAYTGAKPSEQRIKNLFQVNVFGVFEVWKAAYGHLSGGKAIFVTSTVARKPGAGGLAYYAAAKAAINSFVISESRRAAKRDIAICAVAPHFIETPMVERLKADIRERVTKAIPFRRFGTPEEVAQFIKALTEQSNWTISGAVYECSGGA